MNQLSLFGLESEEASSPIARHSDPVTSHIAAADVAPRLKPGMAAMESVMSFETASTAQELALECVQSFGVLMMETYRKRAHELVSCGRAVECGVRRCRVTGKIANTFKRIKR